MSMTTSDAKVERQDPRELIDLDKVKKSLEGFYRVQRENEDLNDLVRKLTDQIAIERGKSEQLNKSYITLREERDFYMRQTVELRSQLSNAASHLTEAASVLTQGLDQARKSAERPAERKAEVVERQNGHARTEAGHDPRPASDLLFMRGAAGERA